MQQCFKTLIVDMCHWKQPWTGSNSKYFDNCAMSQWKPSEQVKIAFTTQNMVKAKTDQMYMGSLNPTSVVFCKNIFGKPITLWT